VIYFIVERPDEIADRPGGDKDREGQHAPSTGDHRRVVAAVVRVGVVEFEPLLDCSIIARNTVPLKCPTTLEARE
jgi:hypothetical protein